MATEKELKGFWFPAYEAASFEYKYWAGVVQPWKHVAISQPSP
jgi:hypothetical protein